MASENQNFTIVLKKFPDYQFLIKKLYNKDDSFKSLCDDYLTCFLFLQKVDSLELSDKEKYKREYKLLLAELDEELERKLKSVNNNNLISSILKG